jgi:hypothetical protein
MLPPIEPCTTLCGVCSTLRWNWPLPRNCSLDRAFVVSTADAGRLLPALMPALRVPSNSELPPALVRNGGGSAAWPARL